MRTIPSKSFFTDFRFRINDRFEYAYDFTAGWIHDIRIEAVESTISKTFDPVCIGGHGFCPPEDLDSPLAFMELLHTLKNPFNSRFLSSLQLLIDSGVELKFDRRQLNSLLKDKRNGWNSALRSSIFDLRAYAGLVKIRNNKPIFRL